MTNKEDNNLKEMKKQIVIERLRQAPPNMQISFGMSNGKFLSRDDLIKQVQEETSMGQKIIDVQMAYLKAFKNQLKIED